jgi:hypothetical protein
MGLTPQQKLLCQHILADASIVFGVLTQALGGIHLPVLASAILGVFGVLLHPQTSITIPPATVPVTTPTGVVVNAPVAPVAVGPATVPTLTQPGVAS